MSSVSTTQIAADTAPKSKRTRRILVAAALILLAIVPGGLGSLTRELMTDAFVQVSSFVAATLLLFYGAERIFHFNMGTALKNARMAQVPLSALLGATPGCGGAVVVVAAYSSGNVGFGAVVAALTATMGDAAFLLIATRPDAAAVVLPMSLVMGVISGWIVDRIHPNGLVRSTKGACDYAPLIGKIQWYYVGYLLALAPGLVVGAAQLGQVDIEALLGVPVQAFALTGTALGLLIWVLSPVMAMTNAQDNPVTRMAEETAFISIWVIGAYLAYDYAAAYAGLDLQAAFASIAPLLPLIAIVIGFIPGCGPQVLVTTMYVNGLIPFAALLGNAISNDGDALFPAIALEPKAAFVATIYSAVPALILSYAVYYAFPNLLN